MTDLSGSLSILTNGSVIVYLLKGLVFTLVVAAFAIIVSLILGTFLAFMRNYCTRGSIRWLRGISAAYIELFRNTPLMLWMFVCFVLCPTPYFSTEFAKSIWLTSSVDVKTLFKAFVALTLFTSAVMAEIIRGGLNSINTGQFESGYAQGFNFFQVMLYIVLPQAFRNIVPTLLSQMITTIKDSSYMASLAVIELMARVKLIISKANMYNGTWVSPSSRGTTNVSDVFVLFGFAFVVYFVINFALSCVIRATRKNIAMAGAAAPKQNGDRP